MLRPSVCPGASISVSATLNPGHMHLHGVWGTPIIHAHHIAEMNPSRLSTSRIRPVWPSAGTVTLCNAPPLAWGRIAIWT